MNSIRIFDDMALVRSKTVYTKEVNGKIIQGYSIYTGYLRERKWQMVLCAGTN